VPWRWRQRLSLWVVLDRQRAGEIPIIIALGWWVSYSKLDRRPAASPPLGCHEAEPDTKQTAARPSSLPQFLVSSLSNASQPPFFFRRQFVCDADRRGTYGTKHAGNRPHVAPICSLQPGPGSDGATATSVSGEERAIVPFPCWA
jgi:hypothetical protein